MKVGSTERSKEKTEWSTPRLGIHGDLNINRDYFSGKQTSRKTLHRTPSPPSESNTRGFERWRERARGTKGARSRFPGWFLHRPTAGIVIAIIGLDLVARGDTDVGPKEETTPPHLNSRDNRPSANGSPRSKIVSKLAKTRLGSRTEGKSGQWTGDQKSSRDEDSTPSTRNESGLIRRRGLIVSNKPFYCAITRRQRGHKRAGGTPGGTR